MGALRNYKMSILERGTGGRLTPAPRPEGVGPEWARDYNEQKWGFLRLPA